MPRTSLMVLALAPMSALLACSAPSPSSFRESADKTEPKANETSFGGIGDDVDDGTRCVQDESFYDVPGDGCDNDGDGVVDNPPTCDDSATGNSAEAFARAMGICDVASQRGFGLVSASFTRGFGNSETPFTDQHGILTRFGDVLKPREGQRLGVLSTGFAQEFNSGARPFTNGKTWWTFSGGGTVPPGFPKAANDCPQSPVVLDLINFKVELKAPQNASGIKFDFNFLSSEWPGYICSRFNDGFIAYLTAEGFNGGQADNISFDAKKNPVSVNNGFLDRCTPNTTTGCESGVRATSSCPAGENELSGTGYGLESMTCDGKMATQGGATGWLTSQAPVKPGETFTLEFMIWDSGDGNLDSSVLLDAFEWIGGEVTIGTNRPDDIK